MLPRLFGRLGLIAALAATGATCKGDPTADDVGTPVAIQAALASMNINIGSTATLTATVVDARQTPLPESITFMSCDASIATAAPDTSYHPVPLTSARAVVTSVLSGATCVVASSAGVAPDTVAVLVFKATPVLVTSRNITAGTVGATLNDTVRVTGGFGTVAGTVTFQLYDSTQATCAGGPRYTQAVPVSGPGPYSTTPGFVTDLDGTWRWTVAYSGDVNNTVVTSACDAQPVAITP